MTAKGWVSLLALPLLLACGSDGDEGEPGLTLDYFELIWHGPDRLVIEAGGNDPEGDVTTLRLTWRDGADQPSNHPDYPADLAFTNTTATAGRWAGAVQLIVNNIWDGTARVQSVQAFAVDSVGHASPVGPERAVPWPDESAAGGPCDADKSESYCPFPQICGGLMGNRGRCRDPGLALTKCWIEGSPTLGPEVHALMETDPSLDDDESFAHFWAVTYQGAELARILSLDFGDGARGVADLHLFTNFAVFSPLETHMECYAGTHSGNVTNRRRAAIFPERALGESCDDSFREVCGAGLRCVDDGVVATCQTGTPPAIMSHILRRASLTEIDIEVVINDPDGDVVAVTLDYLLADGSRWFRPYNLAVPFDNIPVPYGLTTFVGKVDPVRPGTQNEIGMIERIELGVLDMAGNVASLDLGINIAQGNPCSSAADAVPCAEGLVCAPVMQLCVPQ